MVPEDFLDVFISIANYIAESLKCTFLWCNSCHFYNLLPCTKWASASHKNDWIHQL